MNESMTEKSMPVMVGNDKKIFLELIFCLIQVNFIFGVSFSAIRSHFLQEQLNNTIYLIYLKKKVIFNLTRV